MPEKPRPVAVELHFPEFFELAFMFKTMPNEVNKINKPEKL
jgi:hypothetical protein